MLITSRHISYTILGIIFGYVLFGFQGAFIFGIIWFIFSYLWRFKQ